MKLIKKINNLQVSLELKTTCHLPSVHASSSIVNCYSLLHPPSSSNYPSLHPLISPPISTFPHSSLLLTHDFVFNSRVEVHFADASIGSFLGSSFEDHRHHTHVVSRALVWHDNSTSLKKMCLTEMAMFNCSKI